MPSSSSAEAPRAEVAHAPAEKVALDQEDLALILVLILVLILYYTVLILVIIQ